MRLKQFIGIPLLLIFIVVLANRLVDNMEGVGGTPMVILAVLIILIILMLVFKQLRD